MAINSGGPNGTVGATGFSLRLNSGLQIANGLFNAADKSIETAFSFDAISSWRRIIDFKNRTTDRGLYNFNGAIQFFPFATGSDIFSHGGMVNIIATRDNATDTFNVYAGGVNILSLEDGTGDAIFSMLGQLVNFFRDDVAVPNEASPSFFDKIRFYDEALTAIEAQCLQTGSPEACGVAPPTGAMPEPATTMWLVWLWQGLALCSAATPEVPPVFYQKSSAPAECCVRRTISASRARPTFIRLHRRQRTVRSSRLDCREDVGVYQFLVSVWPYKGRCVFCRYPVV